MNPELFKAKVLLLGDGAVGKTSMIRRFVVDQFADDYITTVGTKVSKKDISLSHEGKQVEIVMQVWDVLGQRGYAGVQETALKGARGALMVYDITRDDTRRFRCYGVLSVEFQSFLQETRWILSKTN